MKTMDPVVDDNEIIQNVLKGNRDDFAILIRRHEERVRALCRAYLATPHEADEAAQDIFVRAYKNLASFRRASSFGTWLHRLAVNYCIDLRRSRRSKQEVSLDALLETSGDTILPETGSSLEERLETRDLSRRLLSRVSEVDREILTLREISGFSYEEIAETLKISVDAVKGRLKRARQEIVERARHFLRSKNV